jgi:hypothetical protein
MLYEAAAVASLQAQLAQLGPMPRTHVSGRQIVAELAGTIEELRSLGWPLNRVAEKLGELGQVQLKGSTVGVYLRSLRSGKPKRARAKATARAVARGRQGARGSSVDKGAHSESKAPPPPDESATGQPPSPPATAETPNPVAPPAAVTSAAGGSSEQAAGSEERAGDQSSQAPAEAPAVKPPPRSNGVTAARPPALDDDLGRGGFRMRPDRRSRRDQPIEQGERQWQSE